MVVPFRQDTAAFHISLVSVYRVISLNDIDIDPQLIPISHRDKIFIDSTQARRQKLYSTLSGFMNALKQTSCKPSMSTGLDVKSPAMKGDQSWLLFYSCSTRH
jgi:hypothetical protein